jgi:ubiquinone/menaquinone biosynthesis C-methylase UbiE
VTGLDLDPAMIDRARANAERESAPSRDVAEAGTEAAGRLRPTFLVGDVAALPFDDASFDLVVSTFSMHHWDDRHAGLADIARVVRPGGRILIWDLRPGALPFHGKGHGPADHDHEPDSPLAHATITPWRWPFRLTLADRIEFIRP